MGHATHAAARCPAVAPLKNPKTTINYCALQKKREIVAQRVQPPRTFARPVAASQNGRNFIGLWLHVQMKKRRTAQLLAEGLLQNDFISSDSCLSPWSQAGLR
jgi:hypothetical protein